MKAEELMVGDWVYGCTDPYDQDEEQKKYPVKVIKIDIDGDTWTIGNNPFTEPYEDEWWEIEPIPITPEILEKNGFEEFDGWRILDMDDVEIRWIGTILEISGSHGNMELPNVQYVHELQHALRICGIDKEIVL